MSGRCTNQRCSQHPKLRITGMSIKQGGTHYCPVCGWCYWTWEELPSDEEIKAGKLQAPKYTEAQIKLALTREVLKPIPPGEWGKGAETRMIEQLGGPNQPHFLLIKEKKYWSKKYEELHPPEKEK